MKEHEEVLVFSKGKWTYNQQREARHGGSKYRDGQKITFKAKSGCYNQFQDKYETTVTSDRVPSSVQKFNRERGLHPTQKPIELFRYLIRTYTNEGDTVLDNCMGSGTTAIACIKEKRHFVGFELNKDYYEKACKRIEAEQSQLKLQL